MSILDRFRFNRKSSAQIAKERLQIIVAHESDRFRSNRNDKVNLQDLQRKLITVIADYLNIDESKVTVELERDQGRSILELNVTLPEEV
ncbi:MAG: cell division topological specificity factor MinE [Coxiellaceae bacterium]|nr:MAG: cell division topological specificity factor MinE [Coxiellaceae bacterium]